MLLSGANPGGGLMSSELFTFKEFICKTGRQVRRDGNSLSYSATRSGLFVTMQQQTVCVLPAQETYTLTNAQKQTPFLQGHYTCSCESVDITFQMGGDIWVSFPLRRIPNFTITYCFLHYSIKPAGGSTWPYLRH